MTTMNYIGLDVHKKMIKGLEVLDGLRVEIGLMLSYIFFGSTPTAFYKLNELPDPRG
jgi:hypothetical protein